MRGRNIIGGDVVCLMPTKDAPNQITAHVANAVLFEMICSRYGEMQNAMKTVFRIYFIP